MNGTILNNGKQSSSSVSATSNRWLESIEASGFSSIPKPIDKPCNLAWPRAPELSHRSTPARASLSGRDNRLETAHLRTTLFRTVARNSRRTCKAATPASATTARQAKHFSNHSSSPTESSPELSRRIPKECQARPTCRPRSGRFTANHSLTRWALILRRPNRGCGCQLLKPMSLGQSLSAVRLNPQNSGVQTGSSQVLTISHGRIR